MKNDEYGTLKFTEPHPMAKDALAWISLNFNFQELSLHLGSLSSCAIEGNRLAEVCVSTLNRLINGGPVSDRYLLGLAWYLRNAKEMDQREAD